ncbi:MAG: hypothetical protein ACJ8LG_06380 [Massilia sp.]
MKVLAVVLVAASLGAAFPANAGPPKKSSPARVTPEKVPAYAVGPLEPASDSLPSHYLGHDCRSFAKKIASLSAEKGEFETTAAYNERVAAMSNRAVVGETTLADTVGFVPASDAVSMLTDKYDADRGTLNVSTYWGGGMQMVGTDIVTSTKLTYRPKAHRSYQASNAYGKTVTVESTTYDTCGLAFSNVKYGSYVSSRISEEIIMSPEEARAAKGNIAIMYVGNLTSPFRVEFSDYLKPAIDSPREAAWGGDALVMNLSQIWLFNKETGKVYKKISM